MRLPTRMRVGKKWYSVEVVEAMLHRRDMGRTFYPEQCIRLGKASNVTGRKFTKDELADTFWHEVTHAILHDMNHRLWNNEKFVTRFANRLNEIVNTAEL